MASASSSSSSSSSGSATATSTSASASASSSTATPVLARLDAARPTVKDKYDAVAALTNAAMEDAGFVLVATSEETKETERKALTRLPSDWNTQPDGYAFVYTHPGLSSPTATVILKALKMEQALFVHGALAGDDKNLFTLEINVDDYVVPDAKLSDESEPRSRVYRNVDRLINLFHLNIRSKLAPAPPASSAAPAKATPAATAPPGRGDPLRADPMRDPRFPRGPRSPLEDDDGYSGGGFPVRPDFSGDLSPFGGGGSLLGPGAFGPGGGLRIGGGGFGGGRGARFDPFGPAPDINRGPDFDEMLPPGRGIGPRGPTGPTGRGGSRPGRGGGGAGGLGGLPDYDPYG